MLKNYTLALLFSIPVIAEEQNKIAHSLYEELDRLEKDMMSSMQKMIEKVDQEFSTHKTVFDSRSQRSTESIKFNAKKNEEYVLVNLSLPEVSDKGIAIDAKGDTLEGNIETKAGGKIRFKVLQGRVFELGYKLEAKKEDDKDQKKVSSIFSSSSSQVEFLPEIVSDLENTKVELEGNTLKIMLPRYNPKKDWKKISIEHKKEIAKESKEDKNKTLDEK